MVIKLRIKIQNELELSKKELTQKDIEIETLQIKLDDKNNIVKQEKEGLLKQIQELHIKTDIEKNALNSRLKDQTQKIEELSKELNQIKTQTKYSSNNEFSLESILENPQKSNGNHQKEIEEKEKEIQSLNQEKKYYEKQIKELKEKIAQSSNSAYEQLKAENEYLTKNNELLNNQIKALKEQQEKDELYYKLEIKNASDEAVNAKCLLATISYEKDNEILKWKKYVKKFESKLQQIGITINRKK